MYVVCDNDKGCNTAEALASSVSFTRRGLSRKRGPYINPVTTPSFICHGRRHVVSASMCTVHSFCKTPSIQNGSDFISETAGEHGGTGRDEDYAAAVHGMTFDLLLYCYREMITQRMQRRACREYVHAVYIRITSRGPPPSQSSSSLSLKLAGLERT